MSLNREKEKLEATQRDIDRFMDYVDVLPNGCWYWMGGRSRGKGNKKWYGTFRLGKLAIRAHRFACDVIGQKYCPPGHHRDHTCEFTMCVNPAHLEIVTHEENQKRRVERDQKRRQKDARENDELKMLSDYIAFD